MNDSLKKYINNIISTLENNSNDRKSLLLSISKYIRKKSINKNKVNLLFVCTHNSRRSQLAQVWSYVSSRYYKLNNIMTFSGGTEVSKFNLNAIDSLKRAGLEVKKNNEREKIFYLIKSSKDDSGLRCFSKKYNSDYNPNKNFISIITCSEADKECPVVKGADKKIFIPYKDPRFSEGSVLKKRIYDQCCFNIAQEMFFIMKNVKKII